MRPAPSSALLHHASTWSTPGDVIAWLTSHLKPAFPRPLTSTGAA